MDVVDWLIVVAYLGFIIGLGWWLGRSQRGLNDYFLAGGRVIESALAPA